MKKKKIVVITGAGIDVESGIPAFRTGDGLWENHKVEDVASIEGWERNPQLVLDFYNTRRDKLSTVEPNDAHKALVKLAEKYDVTIVTTNVSDLHKRAGSKKVIHLHGELLKMCSEADTTKTYPYTKDILLGDKAEDGTQLRPFIVWFGEQVPMLETAAFYCNDADICILCGTSLSVYPAAGLISYVAYEKPKYVIDVNIPYIPDYGNVITIEEKATIGITELVEKLLAEVEIEESDPIL